MGTTNQTPRYREIERLGAGGMATVTLAEDTLLGREVALKRVYGTGDPHGSLRLKREALVGASLNHPNLVSVYDAETEGDGDVVIVMEYVEGETLSDRLRTRGRMRPEEALRVLEGVAGALDAIHARGIVHRDVKPANILLGREGAVKLADLGVADVANRTNITSSGALVGSFSYMAPEQLDGASPSPGMDVYALAAVAFEMLVGQKARPESNPLALAHAISTQPPPDMRAFWPQAPAAAAAVLQRGMSADPQKRPATAGELVGRLREALAPGSTQPAPRRQRPAPPGRARAVPAPGRTRAIPPPSRPPRRSTGIVPVLLLLAALAVGVLIAVLLSSGGSNNSSGGKAKQHRSGSGAKTHSTGKSSSSAGSSANDTTTPASSTPTASTPTTSSSTRSTSTATTPSSSSGGAGAAPTAGSGAPTPTTAVQSFYEAAAAHRYSEAWALADPNLRNQLGGYSAFQNQMSSVRSITFHKAQTVGGSSSDSATVAVQTTSVQTSGTQQCAGTARTVRSGQGWLVDRVSINCS
ncbi:MAG TPA: serine/threonine-protein kinase [Solirubrobacteraceae bacterium]|nr:serine/threonine-protein kinase [Solirubrobacteraceae bacterium]